MTVLSRLALAASLALTVLPAGTIAAQAHHHDTPYRLAQAHPRGHAPAPAASSPSTRAFEAANEKMHRDMAITLSGNADVDFVRGMIPHHQGAIDMARIVLAHGKDPQIRKLAGEIISAQEREIAWMRDWLKNNAR